MHKLSKGEQGYLLSHPRLVSYILDNNCERLSLFLDFAKIDLEMSQKMDSRAAKQSDDTPSQGFVGDIDGRVLNIVKAIENHDRALPGILMPEGISSDEAIHRICRIYALLVIGHENEPHCGQILDELRALRKQFLRESPHADVPSIPGEGTCS